LQRSLDPGLCSAASLSDDLPCFRFPVIFAWVLGKITAAAAQERVWTAAAAAAAAAAWLLLLELSWCFII
jgi:hypothetical protein